jgi:quinol monooxygenase YgiN
MEEITIIVPINARPEFKEKVRTKLLELTVLTNQESGNVCYRLHQVEDDPCKFVIYEKWRDQAALDFHMNQDYLKAFLNESKTLLAEEIMGTICRDIS